MRRRAAVVASGALVVGCLAGCSGGEPAPTYSTAHESSGWQRLPDLPLSARGPGVVVWTGDEVVVVGGDAGPPCPANADCVGPDRYETDGAALDLATGTWRTIADAPVEIPTGSSHAVVDGQVFVLTWPVTDDPTAHLLSYDPDGDSWRTWETPEDVAWPLLAEHDGALVAFSSSDETGEPARDVLLDPATGEWSELADDPIGAAYDRIMTSTPHGLVLTAKELVTSPGAEEPSIVLAAIRDARSGAWTRLPDSDQIGGWQWTWTGRRLLDPTLGAADGGEVGNWGRTVPMGGILTLPEAAWENLPDPPAPRHDGGWRVPGALGTRYSVSGGYVFDDEEESWTRLGRPEGSADEPGAAAWAGDELVLLGGTDRGGARDTRSAAAWIYTP